MVKIWPISWEIMKNMTLAFYRYRNMTLRIDKHEFCGKKSSHGWSSTMPWLHVFSWFHPSYGTMVSYETKIGQLWLRKTTQLVLSEGDDKNQLLVQSMIDLWALQKLIKTSQNPGTRNPKRAQWMIILPKHDRCSSISIWAVRPPESCRVSRPIWCYTTGHHGFQS